MSDLSELFARDPLSLNAEGQKGYTTRELETIVAYFRDLRAKNQMGIKAPKIKAPAKLNIEDLDV